MCAEDLKSFSSVCAEKVCAKSECSKKACDDSSFLSGDELRLDGQYSGFRVNNGNWSMNLNSRREIWNLR